MLPDRVSNPGPQTYESGRFQHYYKTLTLKSWGQQNLAVFAIGLDCRNFVISD